DAERADALYADAEDDLTAKEMRAYAWLEVQRGQLAFRHGRHDDADAHYRRAAAAYSGYWLIDEHIAELAGARAHYARAIELYRDVFARTGRPESAHALGDLYVYRGDVVQAKSWHARALAIYTASAQRGEAHYLHALAAYYADAEQDSAQSLKWARTD